MRRRRAAHRTQEILVKIPKSTSRNSCRFFSGYAANPSGGPESVALRTDRPKNFSPGWPTGATEFWAPILSGTLSKRGDSKAENATLRNCAPSPRIVFEVPEIEISGLANFRKTRQSAAPAEIGRFARGSTQKPRLRIANRGPENSDPASGPTPRRNWYQQRQEARRRRVPNLCYKLVGWLYPVSPAE